MKTPETVYKSWKIKAPVLWEKTYYGKDLIDESRTLQGKETGKWQGVIFLYHFLICQGTTKNRFMIEPLVESYKGENEKKMVESLRKLLKNKKEWVLKDKHWEDADFFPKEANKKLTEFNLQKYVKKVS